MTESAVPIRRTKPQLQLFIPGQRWCAGRSRHERLVRKWTGQVASHSTLAASRRGSDRSIRHSREGGNPRTYIPRKNANRDTITQVHTVHPIRLSGKNPPRTTTLFLLCGLRKATVIPAKACPLIDRGPESNCRDGAM